MDNLELYNKVREVPQNAQKTITGGRLNGKTDINPIWRVKSLTEQFGVCGVGWYTEIVNKWLDEGADGEIIANVEIKLYIKVDGEWSKGIVGIGGSMFVAKEKQTNKYTSDECYKMAYTDAISVACKALGMGADVYWEKDKTKYDKPQVETKQFQCSVCGKQISEKYYTQSIEKYGQPICSKECLEKLGGTNE